MVYIKTPYLFLYVYLSHYVGIPPAPAVNIPPPPGALYPLRKEIQHYPQIKLKNFQWKKLDAGATKNTIWNMEEDDGSIQNALKVEGAFDKIETLFPAKVNTFLERRLAAQMAGQTSVVQDESIKFLSKDKNRNISK